ncbi:MAG TPA: AAA family ATPase [Candidatus Acidoferrales bacterium]|nr:AAA family ATPase [Candidatus Acidoferrales bacterium]
MLTRLDVHNFRSIERGEVEFAPITIFFGPTSAGKSTLFYALLVLRNFILNPNQASDGLFNFGFQNLGGFDACVFNHAVSKAVVVAAHFGKRIYTVFLRKTDADIVEKTEFASMGIKTPVPYGANQTFPLSIKEEDEEFTINWNGFASTVVAKSGSPEGQSRATTLAELLNGPVEAIKRVDICPHRRGFFKPSYSPTPLTPTPTSEDEVATLIINDQNAAPRISINTVEVFDRDFRTFTPPGTATTYLQTTEQKGARIPGLLVNDGFGVNQVVYMLAKIHRQDTETVLIEEPEIHLHPTVIRKFARVLAYLASVEKKQLVFTTHSEQFLLSILACVKEKLLAPEDLRCYHVAREGKRTIFNHEPVSVDGQIAGGLASFMEGELQDIKSFLSVKEE